MTPTTSTVRLDDARGPMLVVALVAVAAMAVGGLQVRGGDVAPVAALAVGPRYLAVPLVLVAIVASTVGAVGRWTSRAASMGVERVLVAGIAAAAWFLVAAGIIVAVAVGALVLAGADAHLSRDEAAAMGAMVTRLALSAGALGMVAGAAFARRPGPIAAAISLLAPVALEVMAASLSAPAEPLLLGGSWAVLAAGNGPAAAVSVSQPVVHGVMAVAWLGLPVVALLIAALPETRRR